MPNYPIEPFLIHYDDNERERPKWRTFENITWGTKETCCKNLNQAYDLLALIKAYLNNRLDTKAYYTLGINLEASLIEKNGKYYLEIRGSGVCQIDKLRATAMDLQLSRLLATMALEMSSDELLVEN